MGQIRINRTLRQSRSANVVPSVCCLMGYETFSANSDSSGTSGSLAAVNQSQYRTWAIIALVPNIVTFTTSPNASFGLYYVNIATSSTTHVTSYSVKTIIAPSSSSAYLKPSSDATQLLWNLGNWSYIGIIHPIHENQWECYFD